MPAAFENPSPSSPTHTHAHGSPSARYFEGAGYVPGSQADAIDARPLLCQSGPIWTPPARSASRDMRRFIEAFTRTVTSAHPSLVAGPDPSDLVAGRFLPPSQPFATQLTDPTSGSSSLLSGPHPSPPALSASPRLDGSQARTPSRSRSWKETPGDAEAPGTHPCHTL